MQVTPLWKGGDEEVADLMSKFNAACEKFADQPRPKIMLLQHTYVAENAADVKRGGAEELNRFYCYFGAWFMNKREITQGLIEPLTDEDIAAHPFYSPPEAMERDLVIGTPEAVIERLKGTRLWAMMNTRSGSTVR